jgi:hypothetical protein
LYLSAYACRVRVGLRVLNMNIDPRIITENSVRRQMADLDLYIAGLKRGLSDGLNFEGLGHDTPILSEINKEWPLDKLMDLYLHAVRIDINNLGAIAQMFHSTELYRAALMSAKTTMDYSNTNNIGYFNDETHFSYRDYDTLIELGLLIELINYKLIDYGKDIIKLFTKIKDAPHDDTHYHVEHIGCPNRVKIPNSWKTQESYNAIYENNAICDTTAVYLLRQFDREMTYTCGDKPRNRWRDTLMLLKYGAIIPIDMFRKEVDDIIASNGKRVCNWDKLFELLSETYDFYYRKCDPRNPISEHMDYIEQKYPHLLKYVYDMNILTRDFKYCSTVCPEIISHYLRSAVDAAEIDQHFKIQCVIANINAVAHRRISSATLDILYKGVGYAGVEMLNTVMKDIYGESSPKHAAILIKLWPILIDRVDTAYLTDEFIYDVYKSAPKVLHFLDADIRTRFLKYLGAMSMSMPK